MDLKKITEKTAVSPQITPQDMSAIKEAGFRAIICNRPDGEGVDQPSFEEIEAAAKKVGLEAAYVPVTSGKVHDEDVESFGAALKDLPRPVLAYCRARARPLYGLSMKARNARCMKSSPPQRPRAMT